MAMIPASVLALCGFLVAIAPLQVRAAPKFDANGNLLRRAATGHITNYDEDKVGTYVLPDPLVMADGSRVTDSETWFRLRRPELLELYRARIYGRVPDAPPAVAFEDRGAQPGTASLEGIAVRREIIARFRSGDRTVNVPLALFLPAGARGPVPLILQLLFGEAPGVSGEPSAAGPVREISPIAEFIKRGYGYAAFRYTDVEPDAAPGKAPPGVRSLASTDSGLPASAPRIPGSNADASTASPPSGGDAWGAISAWAWATSRVMDWLSSNPAIDPSRIALVGHSRLGKTVLWAGAQDPRFAVVFSSCAGEMGSALSRRDYGETIDDMAASFPWQFARNFQRYAGHWNDLPTDAHTLIALNAPHRVFISGGTKDLWADPKGEFLAEVAAGPVYRLVTGSDLGTADFPAPDHPVVTGTLGYVEHEGGHAITAADWDAFLVFAAPVLEDPKGERSRRD